MTCQAGWASPAKPDWRAETRLASASENHGQSPRKPLP